MSKSTLKTSNTRFAPMVRFTLIRRSTVVTALALLLAMGNSLFAGASLAQEQQEATMGQVLLTTWEGVQVMVAVILPCLAMPEEAELGWRSHCRGANPSHLGPELCSVTAVEGVNGGESARA